MVSDSDKWMLESGDLSYNREYVVRLDIRLQGMCEINVSSFCL